MKFFNCFLVWYLKKMREIQIIIYRFINSEFVCFRFILFLLNSCKKKKNLKKIHYNEKYYIVTL